MEADDEKFNGEDVEKITVENFEELSRNTDDLLSAEKIFLSEDEEKTIGDHSFQGHTLFLQTPSLLYYKNSIWAIYS